MRPSSILWLLVLTPAQATPPPEPASLAHAPPAPAQLITALAQPPPAQTAFFEQRSSPLLAAPLAFGGVLERPARDVLVKQVTAPYAERTRIENGRVRIERAGQPARQFSLNRAPELRALTASFNAVLSGDADLLLTHFELHSAGVDARWQLQLRPREARLAKRVVGMTLMGSGSTLQCIDLNLAGNETSRMWLGALAAQAQVIADAAGRDALCGSRVVE